MTDQHDALPEPMRTHVEGFATKSGWNRSDGEGAFEFVQRKCYHQGWQDGRREALGDVHRDTPEVAATQPTKPEQQAGGVPAGFPPRIMKLLLDVADRECKGHQGPWEDGDGVPLDAVARQAVEWIEARAALSTQPQHEGWKMVPVKATTPMINAGQCGCMDNDVTVCVYDAILAAAPSQSAVQPT